MNSPPSHAMPEPSGAGTNRRLHGLLLALVVAAPAVFFLVTDNIWEDFFITYRCSLNLLQGHGLVYEVGRRVHVFTSPLGVLFPAGLSWVARTEDPLVVMGLFRAAACCTLAGAWLVARSRLAGSTGLLVCAGLWVFDPKLAAFATNGMETAFLVFFVVLLWRALADQRATLAGLALAGLMWTRPDGFVYAGALAAGTWLFPAEGGRMSWKTWLRIGITGGLLYLPWFAWAWAYYGSPVPNTILAKGAHLSAAASLQALASYPFRYFFGHCVVHDSFLPPYYFFGGWPAALGWFGRAMSWAVVAVVAWPRCPRPARVAGLAFILGGSYLTMAAQAPWYFPGWQVLGYIAISGGIATLWNLPSRRTLARGMAGAVAALLVGVQLYQFTAVCVQLRAQQQIIEWGLRAPLGRALRVAAKPTDTVFLESLGYIGFYSDLAMRDTPGLCAPEVVALRRQGVLESADLIGRLQPDWVVLRGGEYGMFTPQQVADFDRRYALRMIYDVRSNVAAAGWLPGRGFLESDAYYAVWSRRIEAGGKP